MTQLEVAEKSGLTQSYISKVERAEGRGMPGPFTVRALAEAVGGSVLEAFEAAGFLADLPGRQGAILRGALAMHDLSDRDMDIVLTIIEKMRRG
jgi:transcriptional regulator with XRE-family HTH domain